jgi:lipopolysaccharide export system permease protein
MRHLDKLILKSFAGPFILTFLVVIFILLNRQLLFYYDDIIGKGLEWSTLGELISYFAVFMLPQALPLAILLSSLITFGNLAEHAELTAIKSSGISLLRVLRPIALVVVLLTFGAFYLNNYVVPQTALRAYSLLYDIKQKKPTMDLREGIFYNGLPHISIKVNRKFAEDDAALKDVILYDHKNPDKGNEVWVADSGRMYTVHDDQFLKFELYRGYRYQDGLNGEIEINRTNAVNPVNPKNPSNPASRTAFEKTEFVFDLSSFEMLRTDPKLFGNNRMMRSRDQLQTGIDSIQRKIDREISRQKEEFLFGETSDKGKTALAKVRDVKQRIISSNENVKTYTFEKVGYEVQRHRIMTNAAACLIMFLIGAPLGSIIRKGGLGLPVLLSIAFFLIYFIVDIQAEELAQGGMLPVAVCMWMANIILLLFGFYFLINARNDSRLFDSDMYRNIIQKHTLKILRAFRRPALNSF